MNKTTLPKTPWWRQPLGGRRGGTEGQALVEFALSLPFLIALLMVLVETGFLIRSHMDVTATVKEGARVASSKGNAEPATKYMNSVSQRVGSDADSALTQNINSALGSERANVVYLMTYRADITEDPNTLVSQVNNPQQIATQIGYDGFNGAYGVYYNPTYSIFPFQEVFRYVTQTVSGVPQRFFQPDVWTVSDCNNLYGTNTDITHSGQSTARGKSFTPTPSPSGAGTVTAFCGDATNTDATYTSTGPSGGINRNYRLGQYDPTNGTSINNVAAIINKSQYSGSTNSCTYPTGGSLGSTSQPEVGINSDEDLQGQVNAQNHPSPAALRCWRYNYAPWYPTLRRAGDIGANPSLNPSNSGYYNSQAETPLYFGEDAPRNGQQRSPDYVGVAVQYKHASVLGFFNLPLSLTDRAAKVVEPIGGGFDQ